MEIELFKTGGSFWASQHNATPMHASKPDNLEQKTLLQVKQMAMEVLEETGGSLRELNSNIKKHFYYSHLWRLKPIRFPMRPTWESMCMKTFSRQANVKSRVRKARRLKVYGN